MVSMDEGMAHRKWNEKNKQRKEKNNNRDLYILYKLKDGECPTKAEQAKVKLKFNLSLSEQLTMSIIVKIIFKFLLSFLNNVS